MESQNLYFWMNLIHICRCLLIWYTLKHKNNSTVKIHKANYFSHWIALNHFSYNFHFYLCVQEKWFILIQFLSHWHLEYCSCLIKNETIKSSKTSILKRCCLWCMSVSKSGFSIYFIKELSFKLLILSLSLYFQFSVFHCYIQLLFMLYIS